MAPERVCGGGWLRVGRVVDLSALESAIGAYPYPSAKNHFALVQMIAAGPLPTE